MTQRPDEPQWGPPGSGGPVPSSGGPWGPSTGDRPAGYSATPGYQPPGYPSAPGYGGYQPPGYPSASGYGGDQPPGHPSASGYGGDQPPGYPSAPGYGGYQPASGYPVAPGYPGWGPVGPPGPRRPGGASAAGVLSIVHGSWVLFMGIVLLTGASWAIGMTDSFGDPGFDGAAEFIVVAVVTIAVGALCLTGGIQMLGGRRPLLLWGNGLSLLLSVYWLIRSGFAPEFVSTPLLHSVMPIIALALASTRDATAWCQARAAFRTASAKF